MKYFLITAGLLLVGMSVKAQHDTALSVLNINYIRDAEYGASNQPDSRIQADRTIRGWKDIDQLSPQPVGLPDRQVALYIDTSSTVAVQSFCQGYKMLLLNTGRKPVAFYAVANSLDIRLQAQGEDGVWQDIESLNTAYCGFAKRQVKLPRGKYWTFAVPRFGGSMAVNMRASITYYQPQDLVTKKILYSNVVKGYINPGQFTNPSPIYDILINTGEPE